MAALTNSIPEKTIERLSEYRRTLPGQPQAGHYAYFLARIGGHPRHHGRAGAPRPDAHRLFERYEKGIRRTGAHRVHQQDTRQPLADEHRRAGHGTPGTGHHQILQRQGAQAENHGRLRRRPREGRQDHRRHPVLPHGHLRRASSKTRTSASSSSLRRRRSPRGSWCRSSTPASRACSISPPRR